MRKIVVMRYKILFFFFKCLYKALIFSNDGSYIFLCLLWADCVFVTVVFMFAPLSTINNIGPQKKSDLCWSTDHTYPLYFEPLNTYLTSILPQHVRFF